MKIVKLITNLCWVISDESKCAIVYLVPHQSHLGESDVTFLHADWQQCVRQCLRVEYRYLCLPTTSTPHLTGKTEIVRTI